LVEKKKLLAIIIVLAVMILAFFAGSKIYNLKQDTSTIIPVSKSAKIKTDKSSGKTGLAVPLAIEKGRLRVANIGNSEVKIRVTDETGKKIYVSEPVPPGCELRAKLSIPDGARYIYAEPCATKKDFKVQLRYRIAVL